MTAPAGRTDLVALRLELAAGLMRFTARSMSLAWWERMLSTLGDPRDRRVVVLRLLWGMDFPRIGERLGFSRGRADQLWRRAILGLGIALQKERS